jgi:hypothetical protein
MRASSWLLIPLFVVLDVDALLVGSSRGQRSPPCCRKWHRNRCCSLMLNSGLVKSALLESPVPFALDARVVTPLLVLAPLFLSAWGMAEASFHDTREARRITNTYMVAALPGWVSTFLYSAHARRHSFPFWGQLAAVLMGWAGHPRLSFALQIIWRVVALRSLYAWQGLGDNLGRRPGWINSSVSYWKGIAPKLATGSILLRAIWLGLSHYSDHYARFHYKGPLWGLIPASFGISSVYVRSWFFFGSFLISGLWCCYYVAIFLPTRLVYRLALAYTDYFVTHPPLTS